MKLSLSNAGYILGSASAIYGTYDTFSKLNSGNSDLNYDINILLGSIALISSSLVLDTFRARKSKLEQKTSEKPTLSS